MNPSLIPAVDLLVALSMVDIVPSGGTDLVLEQGQTDDGVNQTRLSGDFLTPAFDGPIHLDITVSE